MSDETPVDPVHPAEVPAPVVPPESIAPPVPEPVIETPTEPTPAAFSVLDAARQAGFPVDQYETDADAFNALVQHTRGLETELTSRPAPEPTPEPPKEPEWNLDRHFEEAWGLPKYDPSWDDMLIADADGNVTPKANIPWGAGQKAVADYQAHQIAQRRLTKDYFANPIKYQWEAQLEAMDRRYARKDDIQQAFTGRDTDAYLDDFVGRYGTWIKTPEGVRFDNEATRLVETRGMSWQEAVEWTNLKYPLPTAGTPATPPEPANPTEPTATAGPTPQPPSQPKEEETSMIEDALAKAGHTTGGGASSAPSTHQGHLDAAATRNLFSTAFRKEQAAK